MIKKCDHAGCGKAGICKCPKDRKLSDYWHFCQKHAAEYNQNWNFYSGMTREEINLQWEKDVFGDSRETMISMAGYHKLVGDFLAGRTAPKNAPTLPKNVAEALSTFGLSHDAKWDEIAKRYRDLAKLEHPDTKKTKARSRFIEISTAYGALKQFFCKLT
ncbi:MAG: J domain-containing protein [Rickettsiales bacterium]|jgi:hypothetical protein|nr:J domain-containing protein [Rickettsiales bacterium]